MKGSKVASELAKNLVHFISQYEAKVEEKTKKLSLYEEII